MRTRTYHEANQYQNKAKQNKTKQYSQATITSLRVRSEAITLLRSTTETMFRYVCERSRRVMGSGSGGGWAGSGNVVGWAGLHDEHLARAETKRNKPKQNSRSVTVPQPTPTAAVIPRGYGDKNITSMLANYFAPLRRLVDRDTARRFFRPLPPPLLSGFLWSTSRGSPFFRPTLRRALFRIDRNLRCFGDPWKSSYSFR